MHGDGTDGDVMRFELLGPLRVRGAGTELDLGFPQQRALLGLLMARAGRPVQVAEIVDVLWAGHAPASATNVVRRYVGSLRRLLEPGLPPRAPGRRLLRRTGAYLLDAETDEIDLLRFRELTRQGERAAATGRPEEAVRHFAGALGEWRGPVAMGIPASVREHAVFGAVERELVRTTRMAADAALLSGGAQRILPSLRRAVGLDPLNEALHARLVMVLAACGLQAEALVAYDDVRRRLAAELSVAPGAELNAAHTRVLRQDLRAPVPPPGRERLAVPAGPVRPLARPAQLPPDLTVFAGRGDELAALTALAEPALSSGAPTTVLVSGMPGIGKTALAVRWAHRAAHRFPDGQLHAELRGCDPGRPPQDPAQVLRGLTVALGASPRRLPGDLDQLVVLYRGLLAGRRVLVLLDDADDAERVRPLLPASPGCLALVTSRNALPGLVASGARPLPLDLPSAADARASLALRVGPERLAAEPAAAEEIVTCCGRLPLALAIVAARAVSRRDFPLAALAAELRAARGSLDAFTGVGGVADVRAAFASSYSLLPPEGARLFRLLALHPGPGICATTMAELAGLPARAALRGLGGLADAHLIREHAPGRYGVHELVRAFAAELARTEPLSLPCHSF
ncbi:AAA family ATPase [Streptomyces sp. NBC_01571]|uniref:AfsR/SARP family transcriptional regulator n=1 Tax=Streptomyces sp. NBC_01571 TaxID=2975883 RepID=UPI0022595765|nr:AfsR/SARP family transcriptional regulator [Streptomyces sp. NBC_01571]MCX4578335.1 AAA family ATPase [Streptomyces sp. NBC_01571]